MPHLQPPKVSLACRNLLRGGPASQCPAQTMVSPHPLFGADTPKCVQRWVSFWKPELDSKVSHVPYFRFLFQQ